MRDYVRELTDVWGSEGEQAAYLMVNQLRGDIRNDVARLQKQDAALHALAAVLRDYPGVDTSEDPFDDVEAEMADSAGAAVVDPKWRSSYIHSLAHDLTHASWGESFTVQELLDEIHRRFASLGVKQPLAVIGTVLSNSPQFKRVAPNTYQTADPWYTQNSRDTLGKR